MKLWFGLSIHEGLKCIQPGHDVTFTKKVIEQYPALINQLGKTHRVLKVDPHYLFFGNYWIRKIVFGDWPYGKKL